MEESSSSSRELLFLDTFIHENSHIIHWDHVKFKRPVLIDQIRIIPKNCAVKLKSGLKFHGQTDPQKIALDLYASNLNKSASLDKIGSMDFDSTTEPDKYAQSFAASISTNWVAIAGAYSSLSIAIIGIQVKQIAQNGDSFNHTTSPIVSPIRPATMSLSPMTNQMYFNNNHSLQYSFPTQPFKPKFYSNLIYTPRHHPYSRPPYNQQRNNNYYHSNGAYFYRNGPNEHKMSQESPLTTSDTNMENDVGSVRNNEREQSSDDDESSQKSSKLNRSESPMMANSSMSETENAAGVDNEEDMDSKSLDMLDLVNIYFNEPVIIQQSSHKESVDSNQQTEISVDQYISEQFSPYARFSSNYKPMMIQDPLLSKCVLKDFMEPSRTVKTSIVELLASLNSEHPEKIELDLLDKLLVDLSQPNEYNLFDELFFGQSESNLDKLCGLVVSGLLNIKKNAKNSSKLRELNLGVQYTNLFLTKYDRQEVVDMLIVQHGLQERLLDTFEAVSESMQLKCLNCLNNSLLSSTGSRFFFCSDSTSLSLYTRFIRTIRHQVKLTSRLAVAVSVILSRISFNETLVLVAVQSKQIMQHATVVNHTDFLIDLNKKFEFILSYVNKCVYTQSCVGLDQDEVTSPPTSEFFNQIPLQSIVSHSSRVNKHVKFRHLLSRLDSSQFFSHTILLWSYVVDSLSKLVDEQAIKHAQYFMKLVEHILNELFISSSNQTGRQLALDYLLTRPSLANCIQEIMLNESTNATREQPSAYSVSIAITSAYLRICQLSDRLAFNLQQVKSSSLTGDKLVNVLLETVEHFQSLAFIVQSQVTLNGQSINQFVLEYLAAPSGHLQNRHTACLVEWLTLVANDQCFKVYETDDSQLLAMIHSSRCFIINSIVQVLHTVLENCSSHWQISPALVLLDQSNSSSSFTILELYRTSCILISSMTHTKLKPLSIKTTGNFQSYLRCVNQLKAIKSLLEPFYDLNKLNGWQLSEQKSIARRLVLKDSSDTTAIRLGFLSTLVDIFRDSCEGNLNRFFMNMLKSDEDPVFNHASINNSLNPTLTQLRILAGLIIQPTGGRLEDNRADSHLQLILNKPDLKFEFSRKLFIGQLISRNFIQMLTSFLSRMNSYFLFNAIITDSQSQQVYARSNHRIFNGTCKLAYDWLNPKHWATLLRLVDVATLILKENFSSLIRVRKEDYKDARCIQSLFQFYASINHSVQQVIEKQARIVERSDESWRKKLNQNLLVSLIEYADRINQNMLNSFSVFLTKDAPALTRLFISELLKFTLDIPFNYFYGLEILVRLLPPPLPVPIVAASADLETHLINERHYLASVLLSSSFLFKYESKCGELETSLFSMLSKKKDHGSLRVMLRTFCLVSNNTSLYRMFKRVCWQLCDMSDVLCNRVLGVFLDYLDEIVEQLRQLNYLAKDQSLAKKNLENGVDEQETIMYESDQVMLDNIQSIEANKLKRMETTSELSEQEASNLKSHKSALIHNLSHVVKFIKDLLTDRRPYTRSVQAQFKKLLGIDSVSPEAPYTRQLVKLVSLHSLIDQSNKQEELWRVQECILFYLEFMLQHYPEKFQSSTESNHVIVKTLLNTISKQKLLIGSPAALKASFTLLNSSLTCLILCQKVFGHQKANSLLDLHLSTHDKCINLLVAELSSFFTELTSKSSQSQSKAQFNILHLIDLLAKFIVYTRLLVIELIKSGQHDKVNMLFAWSNKHPDELLIDSISASNNLANSYCQQHPLVDLAQKQDIFLSRLNGKTPHAVNNKIKFCLNSLKQLIKLVTEDNNMAIDHTDSVEFEELLDLKLRTVNGSCYSKQVFMTKNSVNYEEYSKEYDKEWRLGYSKETEMSSQTSIKLNSDDIEIKFDDLQLTIIQNTPGTMLELPLQVNMMSDTEFLNKLLKSLEDEDIKCGKARLVVDDMSLNELTSAERPFDYEKLNRAKNEAIMNTRTGIQYKAPMRGGSHAASGCSQVMDDSNGMRSDAKSNQTTSKMILRNGDPFRTRYPNTSRPPSLHVDEYYRLEKAKQQQNEVVDMVVSTPCANGIEMINNDSLNS